MKKILSLDGGGMRGMLQAVALVELEKLAGKPCWQIFDLIYGTSIGGILALLLSSGVRAQDALKLFTQDGPLIFKPVLWRRFGLLAPRYPARQIEQVLRARFGDRTSNDLKTLLGVTTLDLLSGGPRFIRNHGKYEPFKLWEAARATSAAESFFPAFRQGERWLWDGGNVANNPSVCALADATKLWRGERFIMLSLGTGDDGKEMPRWLMPLLANAGLLWLAPVIINMLFSAGSDDVDHQMTQFLGDSYHRWQPRLPRSFPLDDASPHGLMDLRFAAANASRSAITVFNRFLSDSAH